MFAQSTKFGKVGWQLVIWSGICFLFGGTFWTALSTNIIVPNIQILLNLDSTAQVLVINSAVSMLGVLLMLLMGYLHNHFQTRWLFLAEYVAAGLALIFLGHVSGLVGYGICWALIYSMTQSINSISFGSIYSKYLPTKRSVALGYSTIGICFCSVVGLPLMTALCNNLGLSGMGLIFGLVMVAFGLIWTFAFPDDPRKRNFEPDNGELSAEELAEYEDAQHHPVSNWTNKEIFTNKNFWLLTFSYGLLMLCSVGYGSQLVVWLMTNGIQQGVAIIIIAAGNMLGLVGSVVSGYIDNRFGVKVATCVLGVGFTLAFMFFGFFPFNYGTLALSFICWAAIVGMQGNLPPSHGIGVYGNDFNKAWKIVAPIQMLISATSGFLLGFMQAAFGSYKGAYKVLTFAAIAAIVLVLFSDSKVIKKPGEKPIPVKYDKAAREQRAAEYKKQREEQKAAKQAAK